MIKTQKQMYYDAESKSAALNNAFLEMVACKENPLTRKDLEALIHRRPNVYGRFKGFLDKLP